MNEVIVVIVVHTGVCLAVGYLLGETMGHANAGLHNERPFSSLTWRNYTHHYWPNLVYRIRKWRGEKNPHQRRIG